ncbi:hypothetical protein KQ874_00570 [Mycoplasma sp. ES3157-GEN-MYC]|uniref:hypothetical protein n=1 Tax=Mycoplasma miroungigenitalium TaxID=754515 RepID=UPI001C116767|nr:hypothetical protein [Mycoplasma miroungigenitalium]MBU4690199.1 hypothetical protein [Mycoplasma miroungigenitalium]
MFKIILENINHFSSLGNIAKRESIEDLDLSRITSSFLGKIIGMPIDSDNSYIDSFEKEINNILEFLDEETYFRNVADKLRIKKDAIFKELRSSLDSKYSLEFSLRLKALDNISDEEFFKILNEKGRIVIEALSLELQARNIRNFIELHSNLKNNINTNLCTFIDWGKGRLRINFNNNVSGYKLILDDDTDNKLNLLKKIDRNISIHENHGKTVISMGPDLNDKAQSFLSKLNQIYVERYISTNLI